MSNLDSLTKEHFSTLKQSILNEPWPTGHDGASGPCSHIVGIVFTDSGFWKYSWAHLVMPMTESCRWGMQCCLRARRPRVSNKGLRPCPLCTEISPVSLNRLMMLCTVDDEICKAFAIWHWNVVFKVSTIFLRTLSRIGEPLPITSERLLICSLFSIVNTFWLVCL